jgi:hypothetical protein
MDIGFDEIEIDIIVGVHFAKENLAAASRQIHPDLGINSQRVTSSQVREHQKHQFRHLFDKWERASKLNLSYVTSTQHEAQTSADLGGSTLSLRRRRDQVPP